MITATAGKKLKSAFAKMLLDIGGVSCYFYEVLE
jgi:hypothetical protein